MSDNIRLEYELEILEMAYDKEQEGMTLADNGQEGGPLEPTVLCIYVREETHIDDVYQWTEPVLDLDFPIDMSDMAYEVADVIQKRIDMANETGCSL